MDAKPKKIKPAAAGDLDNFKRSFSISKVIDAYREQVLELFLLRHPQYRFDKNYQEKWEEFFKEHTAGKSLEECGCWFYFPWNGQLVHYLDDEEHQELRTARNRNLITAEEQEKFYRFKVGIAGLSVGSHAALTLAMMGGAQTVKLADFDTISGSNLNRIRTDFSQLGSNKCEYVCQQICQINPYADIRSYPQGITLGNLEEFLAGPPKLDVLVECLDNPELKIRLRLAARKFGIPVLMATDNGDGIIFDTERFDLDKDLALFNGVAGNLTLEEFQKFPPQELPKLATKLAGPDLVSPRMLRSVSAVGKTLYSWPQLGDAATLAGVALSYAIKRLALGQKIKAGKVEINLDAIFDPDYHAKEHEKRREAEREEYLRLIGF